MKLTRYLSLPVIAVAIIMLSATAALAQVSCGVGYTTQRIMREDATPAAQAINLTMAKGEYEARQIAVRNAAGFSVSLAPTNLMDAAGGNMIGTSEIELEKVGYVYISAPSSYIPGAQVGYWPDPLFPINANENVAVSANETQPILVTVHVPETAAAGTYTGSVYVSTSLGDSFVVPVTVKVMNLTMKPELETCFLLSHNNVYDFYKDAPQVAVPQGYGRPDVYVAWWGYPRAQETMMRYYQFFRKHWVSPGGIPWPGIPSVNSGTGAADFAWAHTTNATVWNNNNLNPYPYMYGDCSTVTDTLGRYRTWLSDILGKGTATSYDGLQMDFSTARLPLTQDFPEPSVNTWNGKYRGVFNWYTDSTQKVKFQNYLDDIVDYYASKGWLAKSFFYYMDEPVVSQYPMVKALANAVHAANPSVRFLITEDAKTETSPLWNYVNIWASPLHFYYRYTSNVQNLKNKGIDLWFYIYSAAAQGYSPGFMIEKPFSEIRSLGWQAYREGQGGLLYWGTNRWRSAVDSNVIRNPYATPLSYVHATAGFRANGEASLIYPGYLPASGLNDLNAPPNSSLRFEVLRDAIEENQYLREVEKLGGKAYSMNVCNSLYKTRFGAYNGQKYINYPYYPTAFAKWEEARMLVLNELQRLQSGAPRTDLTVTVRNSAPIYNAEVSNGFYTARTNRSGVATFSGLLPDSSVAITVSHPEYLTSTAYAAVVEGTANALTVKMSRAMTNDIVVQGFESPLRNQALYWKGLNAYSRVSRVTGNQTQGSWSLKATFYKPAGLAYAAVMGRLYPGSCGVKFASPSKPVPANYNDWRTMKALEFDITNNYAHVNTETPWMLTTYIKDVYGKRMYLNIFLASKTHEHVSVDLTKTRRDVGFKLGQVQTLVWSVTRPGTSVFYIDNIRLVPATPKY